jgi:hypothetical protein
MGKVWISYRTASGVTMGLHDSYFGTPKESGHVDDEDPVSTTQHVNPTADAFHNVTVNLDYRLPRVAFLHAGSDVIAHVYVNNVVPIERHGTHATNIAASGTRRQRAPPGGSAWPASVPTAWRYET